MPRSIQQQKMLDGMTDNKKYLLTKIEEFKNRGSLVYEGDYRYITKNEYPKGMGKNEAILRSKDEGTDDVLEKTRELFVILVTWKNKGYSSYESPNGNKSVATRMHFHLYK